MGISKEPQLGTIQRSQVEEVFIPYFAKSEKTEIFFIPCYGGVMRYIIELYETKREIVREIEPSFGLENPPGIQLEAKKNIGLPER